MNKFNLNTINLKSINLNVDKVKLIKDKILENQWLWDDKSEILFDNGDKMIFHIPEKTVKLYKLWQV